MVDNAIEAKDVIAKVAAILHVSECALAQRLGVSRQALHRWKRNGKIPIKRAAELEEISAGQVRREEIRPDIYRPADAITRRHYSPMRFRSSLLMRWT